MRIRTKLLLVSIPFALALGGCVTSSSRESATVAPTNTSAPATLTPIPLVATETSIQEGKTIVVTSVEDSGPGTLRQALLNAQAGDTITFDAAAYPPDVPAVINLESALPFIDQDYLTLDASNAGVILDGSLAEGDSTSGLEINSEHNVIKGLQIVQFSGAGIALNPEAHFNTIGGDRGIGTGPLGEGNLIGDAGHGIGVWGSDNLIAGNLIGTDVTGQGRMGNKAAGVSLENWASRNTIGPNNVIAFNGTVGGGGVEIRSVSALANLITENSIHDNSFPGIYYNLPGAVQPPVPDATPIHDFDLAAGIIEGIACSGCVVELFSTSAADGEIFEGSVLADEHGYFSFRKGLSLSGPLLTATSRASDDNTSAFSLPVGSLTFQELNDSRRGRLVTKPSDELEDNRIGGLWSNFWQGNIQAAIDRAIVPYGLKVVKISINQPEPTSHSPEGMIGIDWSKPELSIPPEFDEQVTDIVSHGVTIHYMLNFWDKANHPDGWKVRSRFKTEEEISRYLEYVRFVVSHFKGRVQYYELWNEPDVQVPIHYIEPSDFLNLARRTIPVIKQIDPDARVVIPSVGGTADPGVQEYLFRILNSDVMPMVDGVSWHPFFDDAPGFGPFPDYYASYPSLLSGIMSTARDNGFQGEFIVGEINYSGTGCDGCGVDTPAFSDIVSAKYTARGVILHLGNDVVAGVGGIGSQRPVHTVALRNMTNVFAGASAETFHVDTQTTAENVKVFTFTRTDESKLVAIWTDGVAVVNDPGVVSTLRIPGFAGWDATGLDILSGFEQKLMTGSENGSLIIDGLLIKDYPFIIRLNKAGSS